jgi:hypothetical protein
MAELARLFLAIAALAVLFEVALATRRWPAVYLVAVFAAAVNPGLQTRILLSVGGLNVQGIDLLIAIGLIAGGLGHEQLRRSLRGALLPASSLTLLVFFNLARGFAAFGQAAVNQSRPYLAMIAVSAFVLSLADLQLLRERILNGFVATAAILCLVAGWHSEARGLGTSSSMIYDASTGQWVTGRILVSGQAMIVAIAALITTTRWIDTRSRRNLVGAVVFVATVVVAQHRSVWLALAAGLLVVLLRARQQVLLRSAAVVVLLGVLGAPALLTGPGRSVTKALEHSLTSVTDSRSTVVDRQMSWQLLVSQDVHQGAVTTVLGAPLGTPWTRDVLGRIENYSPHNWYVSLLLRSGVIGLVSFVSLLIRPLAGRNRKTKSSVLQLAAAVSLAAYFVSYSLDVQETPILALVILGSAAPVSLCAARIRPNTEMSPVKSAQREAVRIG